MRQNFVFSCVFFFYFFSIEINAQSSVQLKKQSQLELAEVNLWRKVATQKTGPSFEQLTQLFENGQAVESTIAKSGAFVTKISLDHFNAYQQTWYVKLYANFLDIGTAYWQSENGGVINLDDFGQLSSLSPKLLHSQAFPFILNKEEKGTLWLFIQSKKFAIPAIVEFYRDDAFYRKQFLVNTATSMSVAIMLTLALIASIIYLRTGHLVTVACALYIGLHGLGWFAASGSLGHLFNVMTFNPAYLGMMIFPFAIASASQFTKYLFNCQHKYLRLNRLFNSLSWGSVIAGLVMPFLPFNYCFMISHIIAMLWVPLCIATGIYMLNKSDFRAKYYLVGNLVYGISLVIYMLSHNKNILSDISAEVIVLIALAIDCVCILLSLTKWLEIQQREYHRSYNISRIDQLTQIGNRFAQNEKLASLTTPYCITFIDCDDFKEINDKLGHDVGDKFLIDIAKIMKRKLKGIGTVFRCGGDEFIWIVEITNMQQTPSILHQLSEFIVDIEKELKQAGWEDSGISYGIATSFETRNQSECLSLADKRMYTNKENKTKV